MKIEQLLLEFKKGLKAKKYNKKSVPLVGPDALKKKEQQKKAPPKTEIERHKKLTAQNRDQGVAEGAGMDDHRYEVKHKDTETGEVKSSKVRATSPKQARQEVENHYSHSSSRWKHIDTRKIDEGVAEGKIKIKIKHPPETAQEKLYKKHQELRKKSGLPNPEEYKKKSAEKQKEIDDMKESGPYDTLSLRGHFDKDHHPQWAPADEKWMKKHPKLNKQRTSDIKSQIKGRLERDYEKKNKDTDMKEAKQPEAPKPRNFVAKNSKTAGAGKHKDEKKSSKDVRGQKHKNKEFAEARFSGLKPRWNKKPVMKHYDDDGDTGEPNDPLPKDSYHRAKAERLRAALQQYKDERFPDLKESDWNQQSDEMIPPEYNMDPEELQAIRNADFSDEEKLQAMIRLSATGTSDEDIANIFDMDKEMIARILDDNIEDIEAAMEPEDDVKEAEMGKIIDYKPGQTATLNTGPGMTTVVDLKKNPTSLTKDPATGKLTLVGPQAQGTPAQQSTQQSTIKAGDQVEIGKTTEDLLRLAGLR